MSTEMILGGTVVVCCIHGREKRKLFNDPAKTHTFIVTCLCCESGFQSDSSDPQFCKDCSPKIVNGGDRIG